MKANIFLLLLLSVFIAACKKDNNNNLPTIAHTGSDMISFKVNGSSITMYNSFSAGLITFSAYSNNFIQIIGSISYPINCGVGLNFQYQDSLGIYPIAPFSNYPYGGYFTDDNNGTLTGTKYNATYFTDTLRTGTIDVIYKDKNEMAGYFQFDAISDSGKVIHITEGRFDLYEN